MDNITVGDLGAYIDDREQEPKEETKKPEMTDTDVAMEVFHIIQGIGHNMEKLESLYEKRKIKGLYDALVHIDIAHSILNSIK